MREAGHQYYSLHGTVSSNPGTLGEVRESEVQRYKTGMYNVIIMGLAFFVIFASFNTAQNYVTSLLPDKLGNESLAILYVTVAVTVVFAPVVVEQLGEKLTMIIGGTGYVIYLASLIKVVKPVVYVTAVFIGIGAAILWVAQGSFLTACSPPDKRGRNMGIFWGIFQLGYIVGNLMAYFVFKDVSDLALFITFASVAAVGVVILFLLKRLEQPFFQDGVVGSRPGKDRPTVRESMRKLIYRVLQLVRNKYVILLAPSFLYTGFTLAFFSGEFPRLIPKEDIGVVFISLGIGEVLGGLIFGVVSDYTGRAFTLGLGTSLFGAALYVTTILRAHGATQRVVLSAPWSAHVAAILFGLSDSGVNTQVYAQIGTLFSESSAEVFTIFQFFQNVGSAIGFYYAPELPMHGNDSSLAQIYINGGLAFVQLLMFCVCDVIASELTGKRLVVKPAPDEDVRTY